MSTSSAHKELKPAAKGRAANNLWAIIRFLLRYRRMVVLQAVLLLVIIGIELSLPALLGLAITELQNGGADAAASLSALVQLFVSLVLIRAGLAVLLGPIRNRLVQRTLLDIRSATYDALQNLPFSYHDAASSGELISRCTTDVQRLQDFFYACLYMSIDIGVGLCVTLCIIFSKSVLLGSLVLATVMPTIALIAFFAARLQPKWRKVHDLHGEMTTVIQENIAGVRVVKAFAREQAEVRKFQSKRDIFVSSMRETVGYWATRVPAAQFLFGLSLPLVLWVGGRLVIQQQLALGELASMVFYLMSIGHRVGAVGQLTNIFQNASASAERILEVLRHPGAIPSGSQPLPPGKGRVLFDHVNFNYSKGQASLTDVSFNVAPGQTVAVVGPTGSGKTTLVQLIPRFYEPGAGRILIDGADLRELSLPALRRSVAVIFQETFLFSTTIAKNIAYGREDATLEEIQQCAQAAQAHEFITQLEHGYDTVVGERGISLSGGQRQRIAIARAFLMNPRILILDDATASVDARTERLIQEALRALSAGRTTFVIAQRYSTVRHADLILVLDGGRLVDQGTCKELLIKNQFFKDLFEHQLIPDESEERPDEAAKR